MTEIRFDQVTKRYPDGTEAVRDLSLHVHDGEVMILVGPSGCGKSTALRMIAGLEEITDGCLLIDGELANHWPAKDRDIAMVFQSYALYPHMTVRKNMGFALKQARLPAPEIDRRVTEVAEMLGLVEHLERKPTLLSGGQRQRVAMGRAIVRDPRAWLMDEPLSNLDAQLRVEMRSEIARLQQRLGTTTIYVTHDQTEAMTLGDRVAVLRDGVLQQVGAPRELYHQPENVFVARFIGSPGMNLLRATLDEHGVNLPFGGVPLRPAVRRRLEQLAPGSSEVVVGIRPEAIREARNGPTTVSVQARADRVESLGGEELAYFPVGQPDAARRRDGTTPPLVARLRDRSGVEAGMQAALWIDPDNLHFFDAESGRALPTPASSAMLAELPAGRGAGRMDQPAPVRAIPDPSITSSLPRGTR